MASGPDARGWVYLVECAGFHKIGWTRGSPEDRVYWMRHANPLPLQLVAAIPGTMKDERAWHRRFADVRERSEWFRLTEDDVQTIVNTSPEALTQFDPPPQPPRFPTPRVSIPRPPRRHSGRLQVEYTIAREVVERMDTLAYEGNVTRSSIVGPIMRRHLQSGLQPSCSGFPGQPMARLRLRLDSDLIDLIRQRSEAVDLDDRVVVEWALRRDISGFPPERGPRWLPNQPN